MTANMIALLALAASIKQQIDYAVYTETEVEGDGEGYVDWKAVKALEERLCEVDAQMVAEEAAEYAALELEGLEERLIGG